MTFRKIAAPVFAAIMLAGNCLAADIEMYSDPAEADEAVFEETEAVFSVSDLSIAAPNAILIEKETGTVIYEKNADERLEPASVTKIMTILLIVEALEDGRISLDEQVSVSAYAAGMGGSQVYLAEGETMCVRDMLKSIVVSSANDAAVAMAEHLCGSEEAFVSKMNERAAKLGMTNTYFMNCTGLLDQREHLTTARDISIMARELISHDMIKEYTTIWTDSIRGGEFGLSNTNKLIRFYSGATGLKTGFTQRAGHCLAATAERDGVEYIAVVLHCASSNERFESAKALLSYAFANFALYRPTEGLAFAPVKVTLGEKSFVRAEAADKSPVLAEKNRVGEMTRETEIKSELPAPVHAGDEIGTLTVRCGDEIIRETPIVAAADSERLSYGDIFLKMLGTAFLAREFE